jgi:hypothetical protein
MKLEEKDTSSGRDIREYKCTKCGYSDWEDRGTAMWKLLSDAREEAEAKQASSTANTPAVSEAPASKWKRFFAIFSRTRKK